MNLIKKSIKNIDLSNEEEILSKEVDEYIKELHESRKNEGLPLFGKINFKLCKMPFVYDTEKVKIFTLNKLGYIEAKKDSIHSESERFICKIPFIEKFTESYRTLPLIYTKEIKDIDNVIYQTDKVETTNSELNDILLSEGFIKEGNEFYMISMKKYNDGDILDEISKDFIRTKSYKYIDENFFKTDSYSNNLSNIKEFNKQKTLILLVFKKIKTKFLKKSKTKGLNKKKE